MFVVENFLLNLQLFLISWKSPSFFSDKGFFDTLLEIDHLTYLSIGRREVQQKQQKESLNTYKMTTMETNVDLK